jgi:hypothetical protein
MANDLFMGLKFLGLSIHPFGVYNAHIMPRKLDEGGIFVLNLGASLNVEYFIYKDRFSVKLMQGLYSDCAGKLGGFSHAGLRGKIFKHDKHSVYGGIGPTLIYRKNWYALDGYDDTFSFFKGDPDDIWQCGFIWYGGEFEYNYTVNDNFSLSVSFVPGFPDLANLSAGVRYKF